MYPAGFSQSKRVLEGELGGRSKEGARPHCAEIRQLMAMRPSAHGRACVRIAPLFKVWVLMNWSQGGGMAIEALINCQGKPWVLFDEINRGAVGPTPAGKEIVPEWPTTPEQTGNREAKFNGKSSFR